MKLLISISTLIFFFASQVNADTDDIQMILNLDHQNRIAAINADTSFEEHWLANDYFSIQTNGNIRNRSESIAAVVRPGLKLSSIDVSDVKAVEYNNLIIVTGVANIKGSINSHVIDGLARYVRVWTKIDGEWKLASFQETPLSK